MQTLIISYREKSKKLAEHCASIVCLRTLGLNDGSKTKETANDNNERSKQNVCQNEDRNENNAVMIDGEKRQHTTDSLS